MDFEAIIHIEEKTPPNCPIPLYTIHCNGEVIMECMSLEEVKDVKVGELLDAYKDAF